ncbi:hypothetical protein B0T14DRAFT_145162 [Immersiella caudata]|uniref:Uncharacterized protein n=1 Tax=Immersiella caudata TaxID=314043 RepID=A0AA40C7G7_9PEZI|nr:hypothetical protein B0T14DRAFT_145162 [Immersiella caudata]
MPSTAGTIPRMTGLQSVISIGGARPVSTWHKRFRRNLSRCDTRPCTNHSRQWAFSITFPGVPFSSFPFVSFCFVLSVGGGLLRGFDKLTGTAGAKDDRPFVSEDRSPLPPSTDRFRRRSFDALNFNARSLPLSPSASCKRFNIVATAAVRRTCCSQCLRWHRRIANPEWKLVPHWTRARLTLASFLPRKANRCSAALLCVMGVKTTAYAVQPGERARKQNKNWPRSTRSGPH